MAVVAASAAVREEGEGWVGEGGWVEEGGGWGEEKGSSNAW